MACHPAWAALRRRLRPLKRLAIAPAAQTLDLMLRCSGRALGVVIVFHRVGDPPGDSQTELVPAIGVELFRAQLALLRRRYAVVPAAKLLQAASQRRRFARFPVAVTFDDDWSGHARVSLGALAESGIVATFFLNGASLEHPHAFWFDVLQRAYERDLLGPPSAIHAEAARLQELPSAQRRETVRTLLASLDAEPVDPGLRRQDVRRLVDRGHEVGFHTREHETLTTLDDDELDEALSDGLSDLEGAAGTRVAAIAYPAGRADARVLERARLAGFQRGYSTMPHPVGGESDPLWLGRVYPSSESAARLSLAIGRTLSARRLAGARPQPTSAAG
jgi:peptidoglycan/xylan/chitin deacetylase (PgdA/CDA1 family)